MKNLISLSLLLLCSCVRVVPVPSIVLPRPNGDVYKMAHAIVVHSPDSAIVSYKKAVSSLASAGYEVEGASKNNLMIITRPKTVAQVSGLALQITIFQGSRGGSEVTYMGRYTPVDSAGVVDPNVRKWVWIHYGVEAGNLPIQQMWEDMHHAVIICYPNASISYL